MAWRVTSRNTLPTKENNAPMVATLQEILLAPETKPHVTADCMTLIQQEVSAKSGVSGATVKLAYKTANTFASGYLQAMVEKLIPEMADKLQPYWADFAASGAGRGSSRSSAWTTKRSTRIVPTCRRTGRFATPGCAASTRRAGCA